MNILPKKRWHVRTKDNIARVRKDQATAEDEERKKQQKLKLAESEVRLNFLRNKTAVQETDDDCLEHKQRKCLYDEESITKVSEHINLFENYKSHVKSANKDFEKEKKEEQEKYEKQIGYLTYLGQNSNEALKLKSWYELPPRRQTEVNSKDYNLTEKRKYDHDPLTLIKALLPEDTKRKALKLNFPSIDNGKTSDETNTIQRMMQYKEDQLISLKKGYRKYKGEKKKQNRKHKHSTHKKHKSKDRNQSEKHIQKRLLMENLRRERLTREAAERARQDALLSPLVTTSKPVNETTHIIQRYNSQFNPELAKQNMI